jgi:hypothetical protein
MAKSEDRRHARYEIEAAGFMRIVDPPGGAFVITVLDMSKEGLRIRCSRALPEGTHVEVNCRRTRILGEVRYARAMNPAEFHVGIHATSVLGLNSEVDLTVLFPDLIQR